VGLAASKHSTLCRYQRERASSRAVSRYLEAARNKIPCYNLNPPLLGAVLPCNEVFSYMRDSIASTGLYHPISLSHEFWAIWLDGRKLHTGAGRGIPKKLRHLVANRRCPSEVFAIKPLDVLSPQRDAVIFPFLHALQREKHSTLFEMTRQSQWLDWLIRDTGSSLSCADGCTRTLQGLVLGDLSMIYDYLGLSVGAGRCYACGASKQDYNIAHMEFAFTKTFADYPDAIGPIPLPWRPHSADPLCLNALAFLIDDPGHGAANLISQFLNRAVICVGHELSTSENIRTFLCSALGKWKLGASIQQKDMKNIFSTAQRLDFRFPLLPRLVCWSPGTPPEVVADTLNLLFSLISSLVHMMYSPNEALGGWREFRSLCQTIRVLFNAAFGPTMCISAHILLCHTWQIWRLLGSRSVFALLCESAEASHKRAMQWWVQHSTALTCNPRRNNASGAGVSGLHDLLTLWTLLWGMIRNGNLPVPQ